jgi:hypothetical protein
LSNKCDIDDWGIPKGIFTYVQNIVGIFNVDVFAAERNKKSSKLFSKWWCVGTSGVDAFCYNWANRNIGGFYSP